VLAASTVSAASEAASQPSEVMLTGEANARLTGTLSIFQRGRGSARVGRRATVNESVEESTWVPAKGARPGDVPSPKPPSRPSSRPDSFEALVSRWPS